jgi:hypothetical protein
MNGAGGRVRLAEVSDLISPGRPLPFRVLDGLGRLLLSAGHVVHDARQLASLLERGACVEYEEVAAVRKARAQGGSGVTHSVRKKSWFEKFDAQVLALDTLLRALGRDPGLGAQLEGFAEEHLALTERHLDAALFLAVRQDDRRASQYSVTHALHTATVLVLTARQLAWSQELTLRAVRAALTMNCAMTELQSRLSEQRDPPTRKQLEQVRGHPQASAQLLRDSGVSESDWLALVEDHHERNGGGGYPRGLAQVDEATHALRAADVFAAKITPRVLHPALPPQVAARQLFQEEQGARVGSALIKAVGIYPPGDLVRLANGDAAIVVHRAVPGRAVQVASLVAANGKPLAGAPKRDTAQAEFAITGALADRQGLPRVVPEAVFGVLE